MPQTSAQKRSGNLILMHLPLVGVVLISAFFGLIDTPFLERFRTEQTFGWMLVIWIPVGILLGLTQLYIWLKWFIRQASPSAKKIVQIGFLLALTVCLGSLLLRLLS